MLNNPCDALQKLKSNLNRIESVPAAKVGLPMIWVKIEP